MTPDIPVHVINEKTILQNISRARYTGVTLHYGKDGKYRYDDPKKSYGVLYLAENLSTALMETVFREHQWNRPYRREVSIQEIRSRIARIVVVRRRLILADLTARDVMAPILGLTLDVLAGLDYAETQKLSSRIRASRQKFDGIYYPSRLDYPKNAIALFEHDDEDVCIDHACDIDLVDHADWVGFKNDYQIILTDSS